MNTTTIENIMLAASAVEIEAGAEKKQPAISILGYSGGIMRVGGWGDLAIDLTGLEAGGQIPILADHDPRLSGIVGHGTAQVRDGKLYVSGTIADSTEAARQIVDLAKGGFSFGASVGVEPTEQIRVAPGREGECQRPVADRPAQRHGADPEGSAEGGQRHGAGL